MAPTETTTLRIPLALRDEIAAIADQQGITMLDVVADAIMRLHREQWWQSVHGGIDAMSALESTAYTSETEQLDGASSDGLRDG